MRTSEIASLSLSYQRAFNRLHEYTALLPTEILSSIARLIVSYAGLPTNLYKTLDLKNQLFNHPGFSVDELVESAPSLSRSELIRFGEGQILEWFRECNFRALQDKVTRISFNIRKFQENLRPILAKMNAFKIERYEDLGCNRLCVELFELGCKNPYAVYRLHMVLESVPHNPVHEADLKARNSQKTKSTPCIIL